MIGVFKQPCGIGDIFFLQKAANLLLDRGQVHKILWPVNNEYSYIGDYIKTPGIEFLTMDIFFQKYPTLQDFWHSHGRIKKEDTIFFDFQSADQVYINKKIMEAKCEVIGTTHHDWQKYFNYERNDDREQKHLDKLNVEKGDEFIIINKRYGSLPNEVIFNDIKATVNGHGLKIIEVTCNKNTHLFDWGKCFELAKQIYTIDTSFNYLFDKLNLITVPNVWTRRKNDWSEIDYLFKNPFIKMN